MPSHSRLRDLESQVYWCWHWYLLRIWQDCGSFDAASNFDRLRIAEELIVEAEDRSKEWSALGMMNLIEHLTSQLDDSDPLVRQEAAISIGDHCRADHPVIDILIERLQSTEQTLHDRACAVWALGRIGRKTDEVIRMLLSLIAEMKDQSEADELRRYSFEAIERLTSELELLTSVAQLCLQDGYWKCRMHGLFLVDRLLKRQPDLRDELLSLIEPLTKDEVEEIREHARRTVIRLEEDV